MAPIPLNKATLLFKQVAEDARARSTDELEIRSLEDFFNEVFDDSILRLSSPERKPLQQLLVARIANDLNPNSIANLELGLAEEELKSIRDESVTHLQSLFQVVRDDPGGGLLPLEKGPKEVLARLKASDLFTLGLGTLPAWESDLTILEAAEQKVKNFPEGVLTPLYHRLDSVLKLNFSLVRKQPDIFLRSRRDAGIDEHKDLLIDAVISLLLTDIIHFILSFRLEFSLVFLQVKERVSELDIEIRDADISPELKGHYEIARAEQRSTPMDVQQAAASLKDVVKDLSNQREEYVELLKLLSSKDLQEKVPGLSKQQAQESLLYLFMEEAMMSNVWRQRFTWLSVVNEQKGGQVVQQMGNLLIYLIQKLGYLPRQEIPAPAHSEVSKKITYLSSMLGAAATRSPEYESRQSISSSLTSQRTNTSENHFSSLKMAKENFSQLQNKIKEFHQNKDAFDLPSIKNLSKKSTRFLEEVKILWMAENQLGTQSQEATHLYHLAVPQIEDFQEELSRRESILKREELVMDTIAVNEVNSHRTKLALFTGDAGSISFFEWLKPIKAQLTRQLYPDPEVRAAKIKQFLKLKDSDIALIKNVQDPERLLEILTRRFGSEGQNVQKYLSLLENAKPCKNRHDMAVFLQNVITVRDGLVKLNSLKSVDYRRAKKIVAEIFHSFSRNKFMEKLKDVEYEKKNEIEENTGEIALITDYQLVGDQYLNFFWKWVDRQNHLLSGELSKETPVTPAQTTKAPPNPRSTKYVLNTIQAKPEKPPPVCGFTQCKVTQPHLSRNCPQYLSPVPQKGAITAAVFSNLCIRCLTKMESGGKHKCTGTYTIWDRSKKAFVEKSSDCISGCVYEGVPLHKQLCLCKMQKPPRDGHQHGRGRGRGRNQGRGGAAPNQRGRHQGQLNQTTSPPTYAELAEWALPPVAGEDDHQEPNLQWKQIYGTPLSAIPSSTAVPDYNFGCVIPNDENPLRVMAIQEVKHGEPQIVPQQTSGSCSMFLEWVEIRNDKTGKTTLSRGLSDGGANMCLVDEKFAKSIGAPWRKVLPRTVSTAHGKSVIDTEYFLTFKMSDGSMQKAQFLGFNGLATPYPPYRLDVPKVLKDTYDLQGKDIYQPGGDCLFVIGSCLTNLFPRVIEQRDNIILAKSVFTGKYLLQGARLLSTPKLDINVLNVLKCNTPLETGHNEARDNLIDEIIKCTQTGQSVSEGALSMFQVGTSFPGEENSMVDRDCNCDCDCGTKEESKDIPNLQVNKLQLNKEGEVFEDPVGFFQRYGGDSVPLTPKSSCLRCCKCPCQREKDCEQDRIVTTQMEKTINFEATRENRKWGGGYAFKKDPLAMDLPDNSVPAKAEARKTNFKFQKMEKIDQENFNKGLHKAVDNGALVPVNKEAGLEGLPRRFTPLVYAFSGKEQTTPIRPCSDGTRSAGPSDPSFNHLTLKGQTGNALSKVFLNLRCYPYAAITDLSSAYHQIRLPKLEGSLRRVWLPIGKVSGKISWGLKEEDIIWTEFFWASASFGDIGASSLLASILCKAADMFGKDNSEAQRWLKHLSYVDDILAGAFTIIERQYIMDGITHILQESGWKHCPWFLMEVPAEMPSIPPTEAELLEAKKILGYHYLSTYDKFILKFLINLHKYHRGRPAGPPLRETDDVREYCKQFTITKRLMSRVVMSLWDISGVLLCAQCEGRTFFREALLFECNPSSWDSPVSPEVREKFIVLLEILMAMNNYSWERAIVPRGGYKVTPNSPLLSIPVDGSGVGSATLVYFVVERRDDDPEKTKEHPNMVSIIKGTARISPSGGQSIPRAELVSFLLGVKSAKCALEELPMKVNRMMFLSDSTVVLSQLQSRHQLYEPFVEARLREIKANSHQSEYYKIPTEANSADLPSKPQGSKLRQSMESNLYRFGGFMRQPVDTWPVSRQPRPKSMSDLPEVREKFRLFSNHMIMATIPEESSPPLEAQSILDGNEYESQGMEEEEESNEVELFLNLLNNAPFKKPPGRAGKIKKSLAPNIENLPEFTKPYQIQALKKQVETQPEVFGRPSWKYFVYLGKDGRREERGSFLERRRELQKTLTALALALRWLPKYRKRPIDQLKQQVQHQLEVQASPQAKLMVSKTKLAVSCVEQDGKVLLRHRKLMESEKPEFSVVLDGNSQYGKAVIESLHAEHHLLDKRTAMSRLRTGKNPYYIPHLSTFLAKLEADCPICRRRLSIPAFTKEGPLAKERFTRQPYMAYISLDLCGPVIVNSLNLNDRRTSKAWIAIAVDRCSGAIELGVLPNYSAEAVQDFLAQLEYSTHSKIRRVECDAGTHMIGLREKTSGEVMGALRSETKELRQSHDDSKTLSEEEENDLMEQYIKSMRITSTRRGFELVVAPAHDHKRLGFAEKTVHMLKTFFGNLPSQRNLHVLQLQLLLKRFSHHHNSRPVARDGESDYLTRAHLIAGRDIFEDDISQLEAEVKSSRKFRETVEKLEKLQKELYDRYFLLMEKSFLELSNRRFSSRQTPSLGDIVHIRSLPTKTSSFGLGRVTSIEESSDNESRVFWVTVCRPSSKFHPRPLKEETTQPKTFRRSAEDLVLLLRANDQNGSLDPEYADDLIPKVTSKDTSKKGEFLTKAARVATLDGGSKQKKVTFDLEENGVGSQKKGGEITPIISISGKEVPPTDDPDVLPPVAQDDQLASDEHDDTGRGESSKSEATTELSQKSSGMPTPIARSEVEDIQPKKRKRPAAGHFKGWNIWTLMLLLNTFFFFFTSVNALRVPVNGLCPMSVNTANIDKNTNNLNKNIAKWMDISPCFQHQFGIIKEKVLFQGRGKTWKSAVDQCSTQYHSSLPLIETKEELDNLRHLLDDKGYDGWVASMELDTMNGDKLVYSPGRQELKFLNKTQMTSLLSEVSPTFLIKRIDGTSQRWVKVLENSPKEASRACDTLGGSLLKIYNEKDRELITKQMSALGQNKILIALRYDEHAESLIWPDGDVYYHTSLDATLKGHESEFEGMVLLETPEDNQTLQRAVTETGGNPFFCTFTDVFDTNFFAFNFKPNQDLRLEIINEILPLPLNIAVLCQKEKTAIDDEAKRLSHEVKNEIDKLLSLDPPIELLRNMLSMEWEAKNMSTSDVCWPLEAVPISVVNFQEPFCFKSEEDLRQNRVNFQTFSEQVRQFHQHMLATKTFMDYSWDVKVDVLYYGNVFAYLKQIGANFRSYLIVANLTCSFSLIITLLIFCSKRCFCRKDRRKNCVPTLRKVYNWCCETNPRKDEEQSTASTPKAREGPSTFYPPAGYQLVEIQPPMSDTPYAVVPLPRSQRPLIPIDSF